MIGLSAAPEGPILFLDQVLQGGKPSGLEEIAPAETEKNVQKILATLLDQIKTQRSQKNDPNYDKVDIDALYIRELIDKELDTDTPLSFYTRMAEIVLGMLKAQGKRHAAQYVNATQQADVYESVAENIAAEPLLEENELTALYDALQEIIAGVKEESHDSN